MKQHEKKFDGIYGRLVQLDQQMRELRERVDALFRLCDSLRRQGATAQWMEKPAEPPVEQEVPASGMIILCGKCKQPIMMTIVEEK